MEDPMADDDKTFAKFKECAVEVLHVEPAKVTLDANFAEDLDADSLDLVELVMALEEQFGITVDESELEGVTTVGQAFDLVSAKL
jgi:acyl carrier protein